MPRLISVSNRLPVSVEKRKGELVYRDTAGGVATGMKSVLGERESLWVGWSDNPPGVSSEEISEIKGHLLQQYGCWPVSLSRKTVGGYYHGFSNRTLWPLFHYFTRYAEFEPEFWDDYRRANQAFCEAIVELYKPGDTIWVHDYHLMLLPQMLRQRLPDAQIGFFLHIPFPSFEIFRILPWRRELLAGVVGADLVGFHTFDYAHHFIESARRLLGADDRFGRLELDGRSILVDAFPMGIDVERFRTEANGRPALREALKMHSGGEDARLILSVDRLDYTKGIPERLRTYDTFLERNPSWRGRCRLICVAVPSRTRVKMYRDLKDEVDRLVGEINGRWGSVDWSPVTYLYRSLPFHRLVAMYAAADVALVTPLRDGMNLVAKEYVAVNNDRGGALVLSEMAGAARELTEAVLVNPYDRDAMVSALEEAMNMPHAEQRQRLALMNERLDRYDIQRWADEFLARLDLSKGLQLGLDEHLLPPAQRERLVAEARDADERTIVLDYDGTLVPFASRPEDAQPDPELLALLGRLARSPNTVVAIVSGRDKESLTSWFSDGNISLVAEHGAWICDPGEDWHTSLPLDDSWKTEIRPLLQLVADRTPGSFVEEKTFSLVWHYRNAQPAQAAARVQELSESLLSHSGDRGLELLTGNRTLEVKVAGVDKGRAAHIWTARGNGFTLVAGDDKTDESMFETALGDTWTIRVGGGQTRAAFTLPSWRDLRVLLGDIAEAIS